MFTNNSNKLNFYDLLLITSYYYIIISLSVSAHKWVLIGLITVTYVLYLIEFIWKWIVIRRRNNNETLINNNVNVNDHV